VHLSHLWEIHSLGPLLFLLRMKIGDALKEEWRKIKLERNAVL
jgi:hypothetical protein